MGLVGQSEETDGMRPLVVVIRAATRVRPVEDLPLAGYVSQHPNRHTADARAG
jgi:hypothetical protein